MDSGWIAEHLTEETVRIVEVDVAASAYREGHIPGALLWNIYADLRRPAYRPVNRAELDRLLGQDPE